MLLHHDELQWDLDNTNSRNALSAYACRLLGKLGSVARLLAREPPLLDVRFSALASVARARANIPFHFLLLRRLGSVKMR